MWQVVVVALGALDESTLKRITTGACIKAVGKIIPSLGKGQKVEIQVSELEILGDSDPDTYPIQPKKHSFEFLRENAHLRTRTNTFSAVMRLRSALSFGIHKYFNDNGFSQIIIARIVRRQLIRFLRILLNEQKATD